MTTKANPINSKKHRQIVETAETLFIRYGIKRITVEEICRKAGVSKMTFYKYFANKIALVKHIWDNWIEESFDKLDEIDAMDIPFPEKIELMFKWKTELVSKMSIEFIEELLPIAFDREKAMRRFFQFIVKAQERGDIRPEIRPEFILAVIDKLQELARDENLMGMYPNYIEFNRELKDFFWLGLLPRPLYDKEAQVSVKAK